MSGSHISENGGKFEVSEEDETCHKCGGGHHFKKDSKAVSKDKEATHTSALA